jgi:streptogramin lyase
MAIPANAVADILYVSTEARDVRKGDAEGRVSLFGSISTPGSDYPEGLVFGIGENLFFADEDGNQIGKFTPAGVESTFLAAPTQARPDVLTGDAAGNLYFPNKFTNEIDVVTPGGSVSHYATLLPRGDPEGLAFDRNGYLFAADSTGRIEKIVPGGGGPPILFATLASDALPFALAFDAKGSLFVADFGFDEISKIDPVSGAISKFATLPANSEPIGLAFDQAGNLYEAGADSVIRKISPTGVVSTFATLTSPAAGIAITDDAGHPLSLPIPEPAIGSTLLLVGVAVITRRWRR